MKRISVTLLCTLLAVASTDPRSRRESSSRTPVVIELFTSEGCSTCPPAEALLARLERQPFEGVEIIGFEEHVDYWNRLGWLDPYSDLDWTLRQQDYVLAFKGQGVYTPQVVVDGHKESIGSRAEEVIDSIREAARNAKSEITLAALSPMRKDGVQVKIKIGPLQGATGKDTPEVWLALTEAGLDSSVKAGENAGKTLRHSSVLRSLRKVGVADANQEKVSYDSTATAKVRGNWKRTNLRAVVFLQEKKSKRILGAAAVPVESTNTDSGSG